MSTQSDVGHFLVRRALDGVSTMTTAASLKTELIDLKVLNGQGDRTRSDELMRHVATLFSLTSEHCTDDQLETYDTVMQRLADLVGVETRSFAARKICALANAPHNLIRRFAFDAIRVAAPVLRSSPVLTDADLIEVSDEKGVDHMIAISMRESISGMVTDVLIQSEHETVLIKIAANDNAEISSIGMSVLNHVAQSSDALARELANRNNPVKDGEHPQTSRSEQNRQFSLDNLWLQVEPLLGPEWYDLSDHGYLARYSFEPSLEKIDRLERQGRLDKALLRQFANYDQFADVVAGVARLIGFPHQVTARMMSGQQWAQSLSLFKILGFSDRMVQDLLCCGPWKLTLSRNQCSAIVRQYRHLTVEEARQTVLLWSRNGLVLD